ncbi:hypothetical protein OVA24_17285 [Luteolibacter sp. SL250]|uniref:hypothetical protein n=1 Tax=Luteolibacter sp. SL250 TaxID=2995170 RepID=UPI00226DA8CB|nr:hypothetical protein [Luteolibacter sp. SL250]WAC18985.1 hypothetical protein OVA24_17285 [Luteolibacter sp. SL250]
MKASVCSAAVVLAALSAVSCDRKEEPGSAGSPPPASEIVEPAPPSAVPVTQPEDFKVAEEEPGSPDAPSPTPGQRLDNAIEKTEEGLETARDKTEEGLRKAAEKTGGFLQRAGETIERKASGQ